MADNTENEATQKPVCTFSFKKRGRVKNTRKRRASDEEGLLFKTNEYYYRDDTLALFNYNMSDNTVLFEFLVLSYVYSTQPILGLTQEWFLESCPSLG